MTRNFRVVQFGVISTAFLIGVLATSLCSSGQPLPYLASGGVGVLSTAPSCSSIESNTSLTALVDQHYPNASLLPQQSSADTAVIGIWGSVCSSPAFASVYSSQSTVSFAASVQVLDKNWTAGGHLTGSLFVSMVLTWNATCPSGSIQYPSGFGCVFKSAWTGNLTTEVVAGPTESVVSGRFVQCNTPLENITDLQGVDSFYPNPIQRPNQSTAEREVQALWGELCASDTYFQTLSDHPGASNDGVSVWTGPENQSGNGSAGHDLFVQWSIQWDAACSAGPSCSYSDDWTANLVADTVSGPVLSVYGPLGGVPQAPGSPGSTSVLLIPWTSSAPVVLGLGIVIGVCAVVIGASIVRKKRTLP